MAMLTACNPEGAPKAAAVEGCSIMSRASSSACTAESDGPSVMRAGLVLLEAIRSVVRARRVTAAAASAAAVAAAEMAWPSKGGDVLRSRLGLGEREGDG